MRRALTKEQQVEMVELYLMGFTVKELSVFYDIPYQTLTCYLKRRNTPMRSGRRTGGELLKLKLLRQGHEGEYPEIIYKEEI